MTAARAPERRRPRRGHDTETRVTTARWPLRRAASSPPGAAVQLAGLASRLTLAQCARLVTGLLWLGWADWWLQSSWTSAAPLIAMLQTAAAVTVMGLAVTMRGEAAERRLDAALIAGTLVLVAIVGVAAGTANGYGTDELAYGQAAASSVLHGVNPYVTDYTPALKAFGVASGATMTLHGTVVPSIAYPSLSFLVYIPAVALFGDSSYAGLFVDLAAWIAAGAILWRLMSPAVRPWVPLFLAVPVLFEALIFGSNDSLYIPFELIALCCWDRFGHPGERSMARWVGPVALGLACCIKQPPWLIAPFLLAGVSIEAHRRGQDWLRTALRYLATAVGVFLVPNLPFIAWNPGAWLSRVLLPVTGGLVPMGIGPAGLLRAYSIGGGNLTLFGLASIAALAAAALLFLRRYGALRAVIPLLPLAGLFVSSRSFSSYFGFCVPALAIGAASIRPSSLPLGARARRVLGQGAIALGVISLAAVAGALLWPAPARLTVTNSRIVASTLIATVSVENDSDHPITPHYILAKGSSYDQAMQLVDGPATLAAHSMTTVTLSTGVTVLTPHAGDQFQVQVATTAPDTFASSTEATVGG